MMGQEAEASMRARALRWNAVFHRSRMNPHIFVVSAAYVDQVRDLVHRLDFPIWGRTEMFGAAYSAAPLLGALVLLMDTSNM